MSGNLPLPALLSQPLVAFTIEFDNEFEQQTPHRTTSHGSTPESPYAPWLVSMVMWSKFMRFLPDEAISVADLQRLIGADNKSMDTSLTRLGKWWGYLIVEPAATSRSKRIASDSMVRFTPGGRKAVAVWRTLTETIENRWQERFGRNAMNQLKKSLAAVADQMDSTLPDHLPILGYGLFSHRAERNAKAVSHATLPGQLSKALLAFAIEFEESSKISLAICANVLRLLNTAGVRARDLPRISGVAKEAIAMSLSFLEKGGYTRVISEPAGSRGKLIVLTEKGHAAQNTYLQLLSEIEKNWQVRFGKAVVQNLRAALEPLTDEPSIELSPLFRGLKPYPNGWRASVPAPETLPHYPMILHRGGFPDGS